MALNLPMEAAYQTIAWLCWVPNLIVVEWFVLTRDRPREAVR